MNDRMIYAIANFGIGCLIGGVFALCPCVILGFSVLGIAGSPLIAMAVGMSSLISISIIGGCVSVYKSIEAIISTPTTNPATPTAPAPAVPVAPAPAVPAPAVPVAPAPAVPVAPAPAVPVAPAPAVQAAPNHTFSSLPLMPIAPENKNQAKATMPKCVKSDGEVVTINDFQGYSSRTPFEDQEPGFYVRADGLPMPNVTNPDVTNLPIREQRGIISV